MKKIYLKYLILIIILLFQGIIFVSSSKIDEKNYYDNAVSVYNGNIKTIDQIFNELTSIQGIIVNSIEGGKDVKASLTIEGNNEIVTKAMKEIKGYIISDYEIKYNNKNFIVKLNVEEYKFKRKL
ncbi:hypothetical protein [Clostridium sp. Ade.TY]|uniref:hypothetical protein n=1 Tax=Clostridium sp. Ade.TY TaxID=1391647 RepID=UPI0003F86534|nr:hypothetical protein [Clostridium sp. Ade.TY]